jgi:hypothetical protein
MKAVARRWYVLSIHFDCRNDNIETRAKNLMNVNLLQDLKCVWKFKFHRRQERKNNTRMDPV